MHEDWQLLDDEQPQLDWNDKGDSPIKVSLQSSVRGFFFVVW